MIDEQKRSEADPGNRKDEKRRTDCWLAVGHVVHTAAAEARSDGKSRSSWVCRTLLRPLS
jgi:hypothetical protein